MPFLAENVILWSREFEDGGQLQPREYQWPFRFSIPEEVTVRLTATKSARLRTPHTFYEPPARASVQYQLILHLSRGGFSRDNKSVQAAFPALHGLFSLMIIQNEGFHRFLPRQSSRASVMFTPTDYANEQPAVRA